MNIQHNRIVYRWLWLVYTMIFCMVMIGGITRLTGSGLSMVEWRPLMGSLPPISDAEWDRVFTLYKGSPQYQQVNTWMQMSDFKTIFFWEYLHRLFGRLIGLVFFLPWVFFSLKGYLKGKWRLRALIALFLGGGQGLLGWFMVKSGLVDQPAVSHFRLAAHLSLAFICGMWVWTMILDLQKQIKSHETTLTSNHNQPPKEMALHWSWLTWGFLILLVIQIIYGAFMAGTRAGYMYQTFPTMNGSWVAAQWGAMTPWWKDISMNPDSIHFIHRSLAWIVLLWGGGLVFYASKKPHTYLFKEANYLGFALVVQFILGVATVMSGMNITIAALHQGGSFILLSVTIMLLLRAWQARVLD